MADDDSSVNDGFGSTNHFELVQRATSQIAKDIETAEKSSAKLLQNLEKAARIRIAATGMGSTPTPAPSVSQTGNTGSAAPTGAVGTAKVSNTPAGDGADGMSGGSGNGKTKDAYVVRDTADEPGWREKRQALVNMGATAVTGVLNTGMGAWNDLRVSGDQALKWERNLLIAQGGVGDFQKAQDLLLRAPNKYNVQDTESFTRSIALALNANWGAGFGGGDTGNARAVDAMAGIHTLTAAAGLTPESAMQVGEQLYASETYYSAMASGVMTRNPVTGEMMSPESILNQIYQTKGLKNLTPEQLAVELQPGSAFMQEIYTNYAQGDPATAESIKEGLLMMVRTGTGKLEEGGISALGEKAQYFSEKWQAGTLGQAGFNQSQIAKTGEFAGVVGQGVNDMYGVLTGINEAITATGADSLLGVGMRISGSLDVLGTELPRATAAFEAMINGLIAAIPGLVMANMLSRGFANPGARGPGVPPAAGGLGKKAGLAGAARVAGKIALRAIPVVGTTLMVAGAANWAYKKSKEDDAPKTPSYDDYRPGSTANDIQKYFDDMASGVSGNSGTTWNGPPVLPGYSEGDWFVDKDQPANIHTGEMILPNRVAQAVRDELATGRVSTGSGAGRGASNVTINLTIARASEAEAVRFAHRVKSIIEQDDELYTIGTGRFPR